ncbi:MAG: hypothetical protein OEL78_05655 [Hyphomicrobiales bacterium]|nr:hypothetical protein [Hyphomicrobiales bacterium]
MTNSTDSATATPPRLIGPALLVLVAAELVFLYLDARSAAVVAQTLVVALPLLAWRALRLREAYLLALCFILLALAWITGKPVAALSLEALSRAAYLAAFILLMALLREGALASPAVLEVGTFLTRQPASRRFLTLFGGGHFFAVLINLGALSLLAPIIQRGVRADIAAGEPLDDIAHVRERRQLSAALRGFSWFLVWAPTAVTQAVMPTLMAGIDPVRLIVTGLGLTLLMLGVSWAEDSLRWRGFRKKLQAEGRLPLAVATRLPARAARNLGLVCLFLFGLTIVFTVYFAVSIVTGVMLAAPIVVAAWVFVQQPASTLRPRTGAAAGRLVEITFVTIPGYVREAVFIACAGFIGTLAAKLVPAGDVATQIGLAGQPGWLVLWALSLTVWLFGQLGISPIAMAVFLASLVAELPDMPVDMTLADLAIAAGTAVCSTGAPFSSGALMLARATGYSSFTLTWRWNGAYTLIAIAVLALVYAVLAAL